MSECKWPDCLCVGYCGNIPVYVPTKTTNITEEIKQDEKTLSKIQREK